MTRPDTYITDGEPRRDYQKARDRKDELRAAGWRVKIRKNSDGLFVIYKKHRDNIDAWNHGHRFGCRKHTRKIPKWVIQRAIA